MSERIRVLVIDDSAFARKVMREILSATPDIEVVGAARDGLEALEKIAELKPDVLTLDLVMPGLDGIGLLKALSRDSGPRVIIVSMAGPASDLAISALELGAVDLVQKPTALATDRLYEVAEEVARKVRAAARARVTTKMPTIKARSMPARATSRSVVVVGTSTGGPQALTRLLAGFPADFPLPLAIALHIPAGYTEALAQRLDGQCSLDVQEASEGLELRPGLAVLARGGYHLELRRVGDRVLTHLADEPSRLLHVPSVDILFESAARAYGPDVIGVVLTGMGDDGSLGAAAIRRAGGTVLTEAERSCTIYGMPRSVVEAGQSDGSATIDEMADAIAQRL